ncbi:hypothetical protein BGZ98_000434 [Dissophora globulifera]|nr:hypothetical protein BGZ98_000434 [Dissophora globulifera]
MSANTNGQSQQYFQDSPLGFAEVNTRWSNNDLVKSGPQMSSEMFQIASPPLTPSGIMARSPNSYNNFGMNSSVKRPPLWPMDRAPIMPFPRQAPTPSLSSKASNLQHIPCKFFKSGACTAGKNCLFSHSRDPPSENFVCKYFLKGNCKFGAKCSLSHSFLAPDRKTSALIPNGASNNNNNNNNNGFVGSLVGLPGGGAANGMLGSRSRLERRASSGAILNNNLWPTTTTAAEPLSSPYGSTLPQQPPQQQHHTLRLNNNNVEFTMGRSISQQGYLKPTQSRATVDSVRSALYMDSSFQDGIGGVGRLPFPEDDSAANLFDSGLEFFNAGASVSSAEVASIGLTESRMRQHLAAPLPIRQRSLPDIFRMTPLPHEGSTLPTSPFYQPGNKALFLSVSCESDTSPSSPLRLHSIPELHSLYNSQGNGNSTIAAGGNANNTPVCTVGPSGGVTLTRRGSFAGNESGVLVIPGEDDYSDSDEDSSLDQGFLPSSLNDLLTTHERQRRQSRQEDSIDLNISRPSTTILPSPALGSLYVDSSSNDEDEIRFSFGSRPGSGLSQAPNLDHRSQLQHSFGEFEQHSQQQHKDGRATSPLAMLIPSIETSPYTSHHYQQPRQPQQQKPQQQDRSSQEKEASYAVLGGQGSRYEERSATPDPFCPFSDNTEEQKEQFVMDDDLEDGGNAAPSATTSSRMTMELNRAVGSNSGLNKQRQLQAQQDTKHGARSPVALRTRNVESESDVMVSSAGIDFSSLLISDGDSLFNDSRISGH